MGLVRTIIRESCPHHFIADVLLGVATAALDLLISSPAIVAEPHPDLSFRVGDWITISIAPRKDGLAGGFVTAQGRKIALQMHGAAAPTPTTSAPNLPAKRAEP